MIRFSQILNQLRYLKNSTSCRNNYDSRKFLKASRMHRGLKHSNATCKKYLTAKSVSTLHQKQFFLQRTAHLCYEYVIINQFSKNQNASIQFLLQSKTRCNFFQKYATKHLQGILPIVCRQSNRENQSNRFSEKSKKKNFITFHSLFT